MKPLLSYLEESPEWSSDALALYSRSPATAFLTEVVHLSDAINHCLRHFQKKKSGAFTKDSQDSLYRLSAATLAAIMGNFEMFQRFLFSALLEATRLIPGFDINDCCKRLVKESSLSIELPKITAYRGSPAPIGQLVADNLTGWHDPERVNAHFAALVQDLQFFSGSDSTDLRVLWQLRHSIVHTAGWLTRPDAQRLRELNEFANGPIVVGGTFIIALARRLHPLVWGATGRLESKFRARIPDDLARAEKKELTAIFLVSSPRKSWLPV